MLLDSIDIFDI